MYVVNVKSTSTGQSYPQEEIASFLFPGTNPYDEDAKKLMTSVGVERRSLMVFTELVQRFEAAPASIFDTVGTVQQTQERQTRAVLKYGLKLVDDLLEEARADRADITTICTTNNIPGSAVNPSLSSLLIKELALPANVQRVSLFGEACCTCLLSLRSAVDAARSNPAGLALVFTADILTTSVYPEDMTSKADMVSYILASSLFGDGLSAMLVTGEVGYRRYRQCPRPAMKVIDFETLICPDLYDRLGVYYYGNKPSLRFAKEPQEHVQRLSAEVTERLLERNRLTTAGVRHWALHPAGKFLDEIREGLYLDPEAIAHSRQVYQSRGHLSSSMTFTILDRIITEESPQPGEYCVLLAFGSGFSVETALLRFV